MSYLLTQTFLYTLLAFLLGLLLGWLLWGRLRARLGDFEAENARLTGDLNNCARARTEAQRRVHELEAQMIDGRGRGMPAGAATQASARLVSSSPKKRKTAASKPAGKDDLRQILGIGPVNERLLRKAGVTTFAQIAAWTRADIETIEKTLEFDGRIERERWIEQAKLLAAGEEEEFLRRFPTAGTDSNT